MDIEAIRQAIHNTGEFRVHLKYGRGGTVTARMWHPDGFAVGRAGGGGYDKRGTALGEAIALFFAPELKALPLPERGPDTFTIEQGPDGWKTTISGHIVKRDAEKDTVLCLSRYGYASLSEAEGTVRSAGEDPKTFTFGRRSGVRPAESLHGLGETKDGKRYLDGACGIECMIKILEALGFKARLFSTGKDSDMLLAERAPKGGE